MVSKRMIKGMSVLLLSLTLPVSVIAEPDALWDKVSEIAANNWTGIDSLNDQELSELRALSNAGDSNAQYAFGVIHMLNHEHEKASILLESAKDQGHIPASYSYYENLKAHNELADIGW